MIGFVVAEKEGVSAFLGLRRRSLRIEEQKQNRVTYFQLRKGEGIQFDGVEDVNFEKVVVGEMIEGARERRCLDRCKGVGKWSSRLLLLWILGPRSKELLRCRDLIWNLGFMPF